MQSLIAAVTAAQVAAEANGTIAGDGTALGLVQAIGTAFVALTAALTTAKATSSAKNVILDVDTSVVTTRNGVKAAVAALMLAVEGSGLAP